MGDDNWVRIHRIIQDYNGQLSYHEERRAHRAMVLSQENPVKYLVENEGMTKKQAYSYVKHAREKDRRLKLREKGLL